VDSLNTYSYGWRAVPNLATLEAFGASLGVSTMVGHLQTSVPEATKLVDSGQMLLYYRLPDAPTDDRAKEASPTQLVFLDAALRDRHQLLAGTVSEAEAILLNSAWDGVQQIADALHGRSNIEALHIVSHGMSGCLYLGRTCLQEANLHRYAPQLQQWRNALASNGEILLYGCKVAAEAAGLAFVRRFAALMGVSVAATRGLMGSPQLGGNWEFEVRTGPIRTGLAFSRDAIASYPHVFG